MCRWHSTVILTILLGLFTGTTALATPLSLEESLKLAKARNPVLQTAQWDKNIAQQQLRQAESSFYPRIDAQGGYTALWEPQAMRVNGLSVETQQDRFAFANLTASHTLYDFGRRDAKKRQAETNLSAVEAGFRSREQEVALQVIETYFGVLEAEKLILTADEELRSVEEHRRVAQALHENGAVTRNDLLQAEVRLASARQKLLAARNRASNMQLQMNFLIGAPPGEQHELAEPPLPPQQIAPSTDLKDALKNRPDLSALRSQLETSQQQVRESKAAFYPELFTRLSLDYLENEKVREQALYAATVGLKINLFDGFASTAAHEKALSASSRSQQQLRLAEQQARLEITSSQNDLRVADERISVTKEAIRQGEENLRINRDRYQERVGTATDVLDAQSLLTQVKTEYYRALYDFQVSRARLNKALGLL